MRRALVASAIVIAIALIMYYLIASSSVVRQSSSLHQLVAELERERAELIFSTEAIYVLNGKTVRAPGYLVVGLSDDVKYVVMYQHAERALLLKAAHFRSSRLACMNMTSSELMVALCSSSKIVDDVTLLIDKILRDAVRVNETCFTYSGSLDLRELVGADPLRLWSLELTVCTDRGSPERFSIRAANRDLDLVVIYNGRLVHKRSFNHKLVNEMRGYPRHDLNEVISLLVG